MNQIIKFIALSFITALISVVVHFWLETFMHNQYMMGMLVGVVIYFILMIGSDIIDFSNKN